MYKDKDKQREAGKERQRRYKAKQKALLNEGVTGKALLDIRLLAPMSVGQFGFRRGKAIRCFADLPPDVQASIKREPEDQWPRRTAAAIKYQHLFPDKYECHSAGGP